MRYVKLYWMFVKLSMAQFTAYQINSWTVLVTQIAYFGVQFAFMGVIYGNVSSLAGWSQYDMLFYLGTFNIIDSLWVFGPYFNLTELPILVNTGTLDLYITKPVNLQFLVSLRKVGIGSLASVAAGIIMLGYAIKQSGQNFPLDKALLYVFTLANGLLIMYSVYFLLICLSFWLKKVEFVEEIHGILCYFALRPVDFYPGAIRFILSAVLPYGLMVTTVAKVGVKNVGPAEYIAFLGVSWTLFGLTVVIWRCSLRRYCSASS